MFAMTEPGKEPVLLEVFELSVALQRKGMRYSEIYYHKQDLKAGHVLTAEDGTEFKKV